MVTGGAEGPSFVTTAAMRGGGINGAHLSMIEQQTVQSAAQASDAPDDWSMKVLEYAVSLIAVLAAALLAVASH